MTAFILKQLRKEQKGFTLIELLAVIVILGVIAAIAVPLIGKVISKSKTDSDIATASQIYEASRLYITSELSGEVGTKDITLKDLLDKGYISSGLSLPSTKQALTEATTLVKYTGGKLSSVTLVAAATGTTGTTLECTGDGVISGKGPCNPPTPTTPSGG